MKKKLSLIRQGVEGGNTYHTKNIGCIQAFIGEGSLVEVDAFEGHGSNYKRRDECQITIREDDSTLFVGSFPNFCNIIKQGNKMPSGLVFPNGFDSWHETHYWVSAEIAKADSVYYVNSARINLIRRTEGITGLYALALKLTDKFEAANPDHNWESKDFQDEIEKFLKKELY